MLNRIFIAALLIFVVFTFQAPSFHTENVKMMTASPANSSFSSSQDEEIQTELSPLSSYQCKEGYLPVIGEACTHIKQTCLKWLPGEDITKPFARCQHFGEPVCLGKRVHMQFCMSKYEMYDPSTMMPYGDKSYNDCKSICESDGGRVPTESEWHFACAGEEMNPYPYGKDRIPGACNIDRTEDIVCGHEVCDHREKVDAHPDCVSVFGIVNMTGNVDESVKADHPYIGSKNGFLITSALVGGHYLGVRGNCFAETHDHAEAFHQITLGCRCVQELK